jgi:hypothetical protein
LPTSKKASPADLYIDLPAQKPIKNNGGIDSLDAAAKVFFEEEKNDFFCLFSYSYIRRCHNTVRQIPKKITKNLQLNPLYPPVAG